MYVPNAQQLPCTEAVIAKMLHTMTLNKYDKPFQYPHESLATILSAAMLLRYSFGLETEAKAIENAKCKLIKNVEVTDVYEDENSKSITTRITFADPEKTLTREEVQGVSDSIVAELKANGIELKG